MLQNCVQEGRDCTRLRHCMRYALQLLADKGVFWFQQRPATSVVHVTARKAEEMERTASSAAMDDSIVRAAMDAGPQYRTRCIAYRARQHMLYIFTVGYGRADTSELNMVEHSIFIGRGRGT